MKTTLRFTGVILSFLIAVCAISTQASSTMMGGPYGPGTGTNPYGPGTGASPYGPGTMMGGSGHRSFKIADINLDDVNEIVFLQGSILTVMDNSGETLFTKTVTGVYTYGSMAGGSGGLDVANLDDDEYPEIIIGTYSQLIVLDHNGDPKSTIALPLTYAYPWR